MTRKHLMIGLAALGVLTWFASRVVDTQPTFASLAAIAVLTFSAFSTPRPR
jgi:hypothetical protein